MVKGKIKEKIVTWDDILYSTNGGLDIFKREIHNSGRLQFKHPLREDKTPSARIKVINGTAFLLDFSKQLPTMTALQFIMQKYNLDFKGAIEYMADAIGVINISTSPSNYELPKSYVGKESKFMNFTFQKWKKQHWDFWENTEVTDTHCRKYDTYAVKDAAVDRKKLSIGDKEVVWAYVAGDRMKFYFPERFKADKFLNNLTNDHLWHFDKVQDDWKTIRIQKSMKDLLVSTVINPECIATQNESAQTLLEYNYDKLEEKKQQKIICYGNDFQGWHESMLITHVTGWSYFNMPNGDEDYNDEYGYAKKFGIKALENLYKQKGIV